MSEDTLEWKLMRASCGKQVRQWVTTNWLGTHPGETKLAVKTSDPVRKSVDKEGVQQKTCTLGGEWPAIKEPGDRKARSLSAHRASKDFRFVSTAASKGDHSNQPSQD